MVIGAGKRLLCRLYRSIPDKRCAENSSVQVSICVLSPRKANQLFIIVHRHEFHKNCIDPWLLEHHTCPLCKARVLKQYGYVVSEDGPSEV